MKKFMIIIDEGPEVTPRVIFYSSKQTRTADYRKFKEAGMYDDRMSQKEIKFKKIYKGVITA